ncbi:hypothetical protein QBC37DRAFT_284476 [Rhypophila decipiens]|uniref:U1-C C2H2-type zinc finger domain-containing protein n=1 Tax=Rhypophila decipiens TaxID=261697 RepID=A0AAN7B8P1_9PEZI|nr:hypothetical protein QBC37DRAFT_284476 [Rhypophila decipiens]
MSEYWKSTPKYWCKHCAVFVRDTKLERANHEATGKHQGAIKRALRDLHRGAEREEREKERAKREVERLNGVVSGAGGASSAGSSSAPGIGSRFGGAKTQTTTQTQTKVTEEERQRQLEQLAELGVAIPDELRGSMAMAGEWTVTSTRVVEDRDEENESDKRAVGVKRKQEMTEEQRETEEALNGLFKAKKPRRWGVDSKVAGVEEDKELEMLLSGGIGPLRTKSEDPGQNDGAVKGETTQGADVVVKKEPDEQDGQTLAVTDAPVAGGDAAGAAGKTAIGTDLDLNAVGGMFKKRKGKKQQQK